MKHIPWAQVTGSPVLKEIENDWLALLNNRNAKERSYQSFLQNHAGFFFPPSLNKESLIVSELVLGSDYRADFMIASCERSYGFVYTFIEIETPHEPAFTKDGQPRARLTHALQQIRDWKAWLENNREQANRMFPSKRNTTTGMQHFEYIIVMGRRTDVTVNFDYKRNQLAKDFGIKIRSFDWFTDILIDKIHQSFNCYSSDLIGPTEDQDNDFSNPFFCCYTSKEWKSFVSSTELKLSHMIGHNISLLLSLRSINKDRLSKFKEYLQELPPHEQKPSSLDYRYLRMRTSVC
ncbi:TPA: DUF4263 domain-containing protein [Serratia fonticola]|uniref:DUF4263 domain-containing protein n=1 Tax=Serratia fonticola TaxID=47917 RepID=UPI0021779C86|nr:DUF4263 domain-containing protein [Serratia fonticola]CAI1528910.1 Uncharacterised protein [Serratia fonticola]